MKRILEFLYTDKLKYPIGCPANTDVQKATAVASEHVFISVLLAILPSVEAPIPYLTAHRSLPFFSNGKTMTFFYFSKLASAQRQEQENE